MRTRALGLALALAAGLAAVLAFVSIDAPGLGRAVSESSLRALGLPLEARSARLHLLRGLRLEEVSASKAFLFGSSRLEVRRVLLQHRPLALLRGRLELRRVLLEEPRILVELGMESASPSELDDRRRASPPRAPSFATGERLPEEVGWLQVDVAPSEIQLLEGTVLLRDRRGGRERLSVAGLDLSLAELVFDRGALSAAHALRSEGTIAIDSLRLQSLRVSDLTAGVESEAGRYRLQDLRFATGLGVLSGDLLADLNSFPFRYRVSLSGDSLHLGLGTGGLRFEAEGFGTDPGNLSGRGRFALAAGALPDSPSIRDLEPALAGARHEPAEIPFEVKEGRIAVERFRLQAPPLAVEVEGAAGLDGALDFRVAVREGATERVYRLAGTAENPELVPAPAR